jgi:hypothetical protein
LTSAVLIAFVVFGATKTAALEKPGVATLSATSKVFKDYCATADAHEWFCEAKREATLSDSHKWEVLEAYCFDELATSRPQGKVLAERVQTLLKSPAITQRDQVCAAHRTAPLPLALEFDHRRNQWLDSNKGFESQRRRIEIDPVSRTPTAHLAAGDRVAIIVTGTNPLLFLVNRGEAKEDNIEQVKGLERLLDLLGGSLKVLTGDLLTARAAATDQIVKFSALAADPAHTPRAADRTSDKEIFDSDLERLNKWIGLTETALTPVKTKLQSLTVHRARLQAVAQELEKGPASLKGQLDKTLEDPAEWGKAFALLDTEAKKVPPLQGCDAVMDAYTPVVVTRPDLAVDVHGAAIRFRQLLVVDGQNDAGGKPPCSDLAYISRLRQAVDTIEEAARVAARNPTDTTLARTLREAQANGRDRHLQYALVLGRLVRQIGATRQTLKEVASKEEDTRKAALMLAIVTRRVRDAAIRRLTPDELLVTNRIFVEDEEYSSTWTKVRTTPLKISLNSPYADSVPNERPKETTTTYRFVRRGFDRLSFGVGLLYTRAYSATYVAADPDPSVNETRTTTTTAGGPPPAPVEVTQVVRPEPKKIVEKERQPRSGYGVFVNYRFLGNTSWGIGGQFGVATSADNPAFLAGVSLNLSSYVSLGVGGGKFRVKRVAADQQAASVRVFSTDEIRIDNPWQPAAYVSLSVNLSGLPLFK